MEINPAPRGAGALDEGQCRGQNVLLIRRAVQCPGKANEPGRAVSLQRQPNHYSTLRLHRLPGVICIEAVALAPPNPNGLGSPNEKLFLIREGDLRYKKKER